MENEGIEIEHEKNKMAVEGKKCNYVNAINIPPPHPVRVTSSGLIEGA